MTSADLDQIIGLWRAGEPSGDVLTDLLADGYEPEDIKDLPLSQWIPEWINGVWFDSWLWPASQPAFWRWVCHQEITDTPRGDFVSDTRYLYRIEGSEGCREFISGLPCSEAEREYEQLGIAWVRAGMPRPGGRPPTRTDPDRETRPAYVPR